MKTLKQLREDATTTSSVTQPSIGASKPLPLGGISSYQRLNKRTSLKKLKGIKDVTGILS